MVLVGTIARPHGHRGEVIVNPETDFPEQRFAEGAAVYVNRDGVVAPVIVRRARLHQGRPVLLLEGVASMDDAEALRGVELRVFEDALPVLPAGTYYRFELVGCEVVTVTGAPVGRVRAVEGTGGNLRLSVEHGRDEVLVPMVPAICVSIDVAARRIVIDPPEGLLDLNAPAPAGGRS